MILSCHGVEKSEFFDTEAIGGVPLRRPTREYRHRRQVFTSGRLSYDSIYRYKRQQSPAVILVDVDLLGDNEQERRKLYCGMTRATIRLDIVANLSNTNNQRLFKTKLA